MADGVPQDPPGRGSHLSVRGPLSLVPSLSNPQITAGADFSIFVTIRNPFDVPVTLYDVQTHLPVELLDLNVIAVRNLRERYPELFKGGKGLFGQLPRRLQLGRVLSLEQPGFATALGTGYTPEETGHWIQSNVHVESVREGTVVGVAFQFPENPTPEELDAVMRRANMFSSGVVPVVLQPGDQVVRQFRLRTRRWLLFTPLTHTFQIQAFFSVDGKDHNTTISFPCTIRSRMASVVIGGGVGAITGSLLKFLTQQGAQHTFSALAQAAIVALLASFAVVVAFARKTGAQSFISVEDFWGGLLIGVSVGFVGYSQFESLFGGA